MQENYSEFNVPSFTRHELYDFDVAGDDFETYHELNAIAEEIEKCRLRSL